MQTDTRGATWDEIIGCPLFRAGYEEIWRCQESAVDVRWSDAEQLSYERGRQFGVYVMTEERQRVALTKGGLVHPRAKLLLMMAQREKAVL